MGSQASVGEEITAWASVSDLTLATRKMKIIPALAADMQIKVIRRLWRSLRWIPGNEILLRPGEPNDRLVIIVRGEAEAMFHGSNCRYIPLLPAGSFVGEIALLGKARPEAASTSSREPASREEVWQEGESRWVDHLWPLRRRKGSTPILSEGILAMVDEFLRRGGSGPRFRGRIRTTCRCLVAELTRAQLAYIVEETARQAAKSGDPAGLEAVAAARSLLETEARCNALQNVTALGLRACELGAQDMAALRVVCDGPMRVACGGGGEGPGLVALGRSFLSACSGVGVVEDQRASEVSIGASRGSPSLVEV